MSHRILIVEDSAIIRLSIRDCIEQNTEWQVCGEAENGAVAVERVGELRPDVVLLDWQMPVMNGLEAAREITHIPPSATLVMITLYDSTPLRQQACAVGIKEAVKNRWGIRATDRYVEKCRSKQLEHSTSSLCARSRRRVKHNIFHLCR